MADVRRASDLRARYEAFLEEHQADYRKLYERVDVDLGEDFSAGLPTSRRLAYGAEVDDPSLTGSISSIPAIHHRRFLTGQLGAESTGDLERYRDATLVQQLHEQHQRGDELLAGGDRKPLRVSSALTDLLKELSVTGRQTAEGYYHMKGWVTHHNTDLWRSQ